MSSSSIVLVVGGAGYIGSHAVRGLREAGYRPVVFDNLSTGHWEAVPSDVPLVVGDLADAGMLEAAFQTHTPSAVMHFAACIEPAESVRDPRRFYRNNVENSLALMNAMVDHGVKHMVFSSSAAVYGQPERMPIREDAPKMPLSTYGESKRVIEQALEAYDRAYGLRSISLRYFNACGADPAGDIGEAHPQKIHLIEIALLTALGKREAVGVFGTDYPTPDGSAIRDYVHVVDLAQAHVRALRALEAGAATTAYNVALGRGFSVKEVIDAAERVVGRSIPRRMEPRRPGDPAELVADPARIRAELGFSPRYTRLEEMIETAWRWHSSHPDDYAGAGGR